MFLQSSYLPHNLFFYLALVFFIRMTSSQVTPSQSYTHPVMFFDDSKTISREAVSSFPIKEFQVTDDFIAQLSLTGQLNIWRIENNNLQFTFKSPVTGDAFRTFGISSDQSILAVISMGRKIYIYNLNSTGELLYSYQIQSLGNYRKITVARNEIVILYTALNYVNYVKRLKLNGAPLGNDYLLKPSPTVFNIKICEPPNQPSKYFVLAWKDRCYFQLSFCTVETQNCVHHSQFFTNQAICDSFQWSSINPIYKADFDQNCSKVLFHHRTNGLKTFDITSRTFENTFHNTIVLNITQTAFMDTYNLFIGVITFSGQYKVYQNYPTTGVFTQHYNMPFSGEFSQYNKKHKIFIVANHSMIFTYPLTCEDTSMTLVNEGYCRTCPLNCKQCNYQGICTLCNQSYVFQDQNNTCIQEELNHPPNQGSLGQTAQPNNSNDTSSQNQTNKVQTQNETNSNNHELIQDDQTSNTSQFNTSNKIESKTTNPQITTDPKIINPIFPYEYSVAKFVNQQLSQPVINVAINAFIFIKVFPLAFFFLRFINFWSICSFYLLTGVPLPKHLFEILNLIYQKINDSIFEKVGLPYEFKLSSHQKITGFLSERYNLTSDFVDTNFENLCLLLFSYLILGTFYALKTWLPRTNAIARVCSKINYPMAVLGQFISVMGTFFTNSGMIERHSYHHNFYEKWNMVMEFFFVGISLTSFGAVLSLIQDKFLNKKLLKIKRSQKRSWLIAFLCNSIVPALAIREKFMGFYVFNLVFFFYGTYSAVNQTLWRLNSIVLSLQLVIFNIGALIMLIFGNQNYPIIYHHTGLCMVILLFLGAVHQLLTLFCQLVYEMIKVVCYKSKSTSKDKNGLKDKKYIIKRKEDLEGKNQIKKLKSVNFLPKNYEKNIEKSKINKIIKFIKLIPFEMADKNQKIPVINIKKTEFKKQNFATKFTKKNNQIKRHFNDIKKLNIEIIN